MMILKCLKTSLILPAVFAAVYCSAHEGDDPLLLHAMLNQLELRGGDTTNVSALDGQLWIGKDRNKLWLKTELERQHGNTQRAEVHALYSHAITPFWDLQVGVRHDGKPNPTRDWGVIGVQGLAPYLFDVDAALFVGKSGQSAARFTAEYDMLFTQRLVLLPSITVNFYGQNDAETGRGAGLSDVEAGLRLRYEIRRELAPYLGFDWRKNYGTTADFAKVNRQAISESEWVVGLRAWF